MLHSNQLWVYVIASIFAISSKFLLRINNKHIFNPANFGIIIVLFCTNAAWLSPGQWGNASWLLWLFIGFGCYISYRVRVIDMVLIFAGCYWGGIMLQSLMVANPWPVILYKIENGMTILYMFFMLSDPATMPNAKKSRAIYGISVAVLALIFKFQYLITYNLIYSLFILAPLVPILDTIFMSKKHPWRTQS